MTDNVEKSGAEDSGSVRLHVTVPPHIAEEIEEHADDYYNGNRSRMFRSAVKIDRQQKSGVNTVDLKLMRGKIESIDETLADHNERLEGIETQLQTLQAGTERQTNRTNAVLSPNDESKDNEILHDIFEILDDHNQPIPMGDIVAAADHPLKSIHDAVTQLLNEGYLKSIGESDDAIRYGLADSKPTNQ